MALLHVPLNQIDEGRLQDLITSGAAQRRAIDYKRATYGNVHADYAGFLADASSFASTSGGDLVLGIDATNGIPTAVTPLNMQMDGKKFRLEQIARGGFQPRIANIAFHVVPIQAVVMSSSFGSLVATTPHTGSFATAAIVFGHARPPGNMSQTSVNSERFSTPVPSSRTAFATSASTASPKSPLGKPRLS
ncbi:hypothetical protein [Roseiarcus sp.]|uniref:hypothetical protein n=1 Tax=Roseiarcus sp. TaxID=1969460 RepID=UPI003F9D1593